MQTTFLVGRRGSRPRASPLEAFEALSAHVSDETIDHALEHRIETVPFAACVQALVSLARTTKRSNAMVWQKNVLEKSKPWTSIIERTAHRVLTASPTENFESKTSFGALTRSLGHLRIGDSARLSRFAKTPLDHIELLRYHALLNDPPDTLEFDRVENAVRETITKLEWIAPYVLTSLAMLFDSEAAMKVSRLETINSLAWDVMQYNPKIQTDKHIIEDVRDAAFVLLNEARRCSVLERFAVPGGEPLNNDPRTVSLFQNEVTELVRKLSLKHATIKVESETSEGVDIALFGPNGKVALQCHGPTHFVWDGSRIEGRTKLRETLLVRRDGYLSVSSINAQNWDRAKSTGRVNMVKEILKRAL